MNEEETSESGSPIYRYDLDQRNKFESPINDGSIEEISDHIEKHVGKIHLVWHELISDQVHIDIHWVKPGNGRPFHTLVTSGMSDKPMTTPDEAKDWSHTELSICLPADWQLSEEAFKDERNYWPVRWLKMLARFPHEYNTWLGYGHTIPNGNPPKPFSENTQLNTMLLLPSLALEPDFYRLELPSKTIHFYSLFPLYSEEVELKMKGGVEALFDGFEAYEVWDVLELDRPNTAV